MTDLETPAAPPMLVESKVFRYVSEAVQEFLAGPRGACWAPPVPAPAGSVRDAPSLPTPRKNV